MISFLQTKEIPKNKEIPKYRTPTHIADPASYDKMLIRFRFDLLDFEHKWWGWNKLEKEQYIEFLKFLQAIEKQTWAEAKITAGGKKRGSNNHSLYVSRFSKKAQERIKELNLEKVIGDQLFSFRMASLIRLYGHREENFFRIIWHDPFHDSLEKGAYPV